MLFRDRPCVSTVCGIRPGQVDCVTALYRYCFVNRVKFINELVLYTFVQEHCHIIVLYHPSLGHCSECDYSSDSDATTDILLCLCWTNDVSDRFVYNSEQKIKIQLSWTARGYIAALIAIRHGLQVFLHHLCAIHLPLICANHLVLNLQHYCLRCSLQRRSYTIG